jgi:hypothetical protein
VGVETLKLEAWDVEDTGLGKMGACTLPELSDCCCCTKRKDAGCTPPPLNSCDASLPRSCCSIADSTIRLHSQLLAVVGGRIGAVVVASFAIKDVEC